MNQPNYYSIITADVRYDKDLVPNAKLLYGEITALAYKEGFCWATNEYFAELYNVSNTTVSEWIRQLNDKGYIKSEVSNNYKRKIWIKEGFREKPKGVSGKAEGGVSGKAEKSITSINIKNNSSDEEFSEIQEQEIESTLGFPTPEGWSSEYEGGDSDTLASLVWYDENGKWVKKSEINRLKKQWNASSQNKNLEIVTGGYGTKPVFKRDFLPKQSYIENKPMSYETAFSRKMIKKLCEMQDIPKLDGAFNHKSADEIREKMKASLEKRNMPIGDDEESDAKLVTQFGFFLAKIQKEDPFQWKNMTSLDYINRNFYKLDKLIK